MAYILSIQLDLHWTKEVIQAFNVLVIPCTMYSAKIVGLDFKTTKAKTKFYKVTMDET